MKFVLRPYQEKSIEQARAAFRNGQKRIIIYQPTGTGKTATACGLIEMARAKGSRVAFVCNRVQLIEQTSRVFTEQGIYHGIIQGANTVGYDRDVIVCSIQTLVKRGMPDVDIIIVDEAHQCAGTRAFIDIFKGKFVIGLTATPYQKGLGRYIKDFQGPLFEGVACGIEMREAIDAGYLVPADVWGPPGPDLSQVKCTAGEYQEDSLAEVMDKPDLVGDVVSHWLRLAPGKQTMVFAVKISHSQHICEQFVQSGVNARHVDYHMSDEEKRAIYADLRDGKFTVLCNCALLSEGADFPAVECVILARPTKSRVRFTQMVGRGLRPAPGKDRAIVLDHGGCFARLGFPWDFSVAHLDDGKAKKTGAKDPKEKPVPTPTPCPECHFMRPNKGKCPSCGYTPQAPSEVEHADGELVQLSGKKQPIKKAESLAAKGKQAIYSQLLFHAQARGYKQGWAAQKYKSLFGVWPRGLEDVTVPPEPETLAWIRHEQIKWAKTQGRRW